MNLPTEFITFVKKYFQLEPGILDKLFASHPDAAERGEKLRSRAMQYRALVENYRDPSGAHVNRLNESFYKSYAEAHNDFHKKTEAFGIAVLEEASKGNTLAQKYASDSLSNPGGLCVYFALAGAKGE